MKKSQLFMSLMSLSLLSFSITAQAESVEPHKTVITGTNSPQHHYHDFTMNQYTHPALAFDYDQKALLDENGKKYIALSFDDGPDRQFTDKIADYLASRKIQATFFLIGNRVRVNHDVVSELISDGQEIGCHSDTHPVMTKLSKDALDNEFKMSLSSLKEAGALHVVWFRPPYGEANADVVKMASHYGMDTIRWDIDTNDWKKDRTPKEVEDEIMNNVHPGAVVLMHSIKEDTSEAIPHIVDDLIKAGYHPVTISKLWEEIQKHRIASIPVASLVQKSPY